MARSGTSASSAADFNRTLSAGYTVGLVCKTTPMFPGSGGGQMCASPHLSVLPQCRKHRVGRPAREVLAVGTGASPTVRSASGVRGVLGGELDRLGPGRSIEWVERGLLSRDDLGDQLYAIWISPWKFRVLGWGGLGTLILERLYDPPPIPRHLVDRWAVRSTAETKGSFLCTILKQVSNQIGRKRRLDFGPPIRQGRACISPEYGVPLCEDERPEGGIGLRISTKGV